jgi:hypothetical protein
VLDSFTVEARQTKKEKKVNMAVLFFPFTFFPIDRRDNSEHTGRRRRKRKRKRKRRRKRDKYTFLRTFDQCLAVVSE